MSRYGVLKSKKFKEYLNQRRYEREVEERLEEEQIQEQTRQRQISEKIKKEKRKLQETFESLKSDWRSELFPQEEQFEPVEIIEEIKVKVPEKLKSNWRKELNEGMTTGGGEIQLAPTSEPLDILDAGDPLTFNNLNGGPDLGDFDGGVSGDGLSGTRIVSSGSGSNDTDGFNLGKDYLAFNLQSYDDGDEAGRQNFRFAVLTPMDTTRATTLEITAIVGNNSNGGESPEIGEDITLGYVTGPNSYSNVFDDNFNKVVVVPYNGSGNLRTYSVSIPNNQFHNLRKENISFVLVSRQNTSSVLTSDNYGITEIKLKRTTPISLIAPLDTPEAVSFMRVGTGPNMETPEQRYRRITQQLLASKKYTTTKFGSNYPGSNFSGLKGVSASPIGKQASYATWGKAAEKNAQQASSTFNQSQQSTQSYSSKQTPVGTQIKLPGGGTLTRVSDVGFTPQITFTYDKVTDFGVQKVTTTIPRSVGSTQPVSLTPPKTQSSSNNITYTTYRGGLRTAGKVTGTSPISSVPSTPPKTQTPQKSLTPKQLADIDKQIKDLQRQSEKNKQDAAYNMNMARLNAVIAGGAIGAGAGIIGGALLGGGASAAAAASAATKTGPTAARAFAKANPGKYNPFLSHQANKYFNLPRK